MRTSHLILALLIASQSSIFAQQKNIVKHQEFQTKAVMAYYSKDYSGWLDYNIKAHEAIPNHPRTIYYLADAYALNGDSENALQYLSRAIEMGLGWSAGADKDFQSLKGDPKFIKLLKRIDELKKPVSTSEVAFTLPERDLIPEGIAYDPVEKCFYLSSIYKSKIVKIDRNGKATDFTTEKQDGLRPVVGMKVDAKRRHLWACSEVSSLHYRDADSTEMGWSGVFKYDLKTGKLIRKYTIFEKGVQHLFNDIVITKSGSVYITDSRSKEIYRISPEKDALEVFLKFEGFGFLNGIALSPNEKSIYVADDSGIAFIHLQSKKLDYLPHPQNLATIGIDGLYYFQNSLLAVQNGLGGEARISRFRLNKNGDTITGSEILELGNPHFMIPTTGAVAKNVFYYIANSQLRSFDKSNQILPNDKLKDVVILKTKLK